MSTNFETLIACARRISNEEIIEQGMQALESSGLPVDEVAALARSVGLELVDVAYSLGSRRGPSPVRTSSDVSRRPGRRDSTSDIAAFALRFRQTSAKSWKEIFHEWRNTFPEDRRVRSHEDIREAYRRHFGDKCRQRVKRQRIVP